MANEVQRLDATGAGATGVSVVNAAQAISQPITLNGVRSAMNALWGDDNTSVVDNGNSTFDITFVGACANLNIPEMAVTTYTGSGAQPYFSTITEGSSVGRVGSAKFNRNLVPGVR